MTINVLPPVHALVYCCKDPRVLWMSTHRCFAPPLVPLIRLLRPDDEAQEMEVPATDDCYPDGAYYYVEAADDQE